MSVVHLTIPKVIISDYSIMKMIWVVALSATEFGKAHNISILFICPETSFSLLTEQGCSVDGNHVVKWAEQPVCLCFDETALKYSVRRKGACW